MPTVVHLMSDVTTKSNSNALLDRLKAGSGEATTDQATDTPLHQNFSVTASPDGLALLPLTDGFNQNRDFEAPRLGIGRSTIQPTERFPKVRIPQHIKRAVRLENAIETFRQRLDLLKLDRGTTAFRIGQFLKKRQAVQERFLSKYDLTLGGFCRITKHNLKDICYADATLLARHSGRSSVDVAYDITAYQFKLDEDITKFAKTLKREPEKVKAALEEFFIGLYTPEQQDIEVPPELVDLMEELGEAGFRTTLRAVLNI